MHPQGEERRTLKRRAGDRRAQDIPRRDAARDRLHSLYEISKTLTAFESIEKTLPLVMGSVSRVVRLKRAILIVQGDDHPSVVVWTPDGVDVDDLSGAESDAQASFTYLSSDTGGPLRSRRHLVALPLVVDHQRAFGILQLEGEVADAPDLGFVNATANQLAIAIQRSYAETKQAGLFQREQQARAEAEAANQAKDEFLAIVSHELRTPLSSILGYAQLLGTGRLDAVQTARAVDVISRNAESQKRLIGDILDAQSIVAGRLRLEIGAADMVAVAESVRDALKPAADAKSIDVALSIDSSLIVAYGDTERLQQVLWNLLSNAIKFTPPHGRVRIGLRALGNAQVEVTVSDTGPGVPPEFLPHIFDRFRQADASRTRRHGGLGLGLAIVQSLVALHGGTVTAANGLDGGALFTVTLPQPALVELAPLRSIDDGSAGAAPSLDRVRVLVVDDVADDRDLLARMLKVRGAEVFVAASAAEGFAAIERERPDVLLSDIGMPDMDGHAFLRRLRSLSAAQGGQTPAVAVTAFAGTDERARAEAAGFQAHVAKPVDPPALAAVVSRLARHGAVKVDVATPL